MTAAPLEFFFALREVWKVSYCFSFHVIDACLSRRLQLSPCAPSTLPRRRWSSFLNRRPCLRAAAFPLKMRVIMNNSKSQSFAQNLQAYLNFWTHFGVTQMRWVWLWRRLVYSEHNHQEQSFYPKSSMNLCGKKKLFIFIYIEMYFYIFKDMAHMHWYYWNCAYLDFKNKSINRYPTAKSEMLNFKC